MTVWVGFSPALQLQPSPSRRADFDPPRSKTSATPTIIVGNAKIANDLLDKRSNIYSSRPRFAIAGDLIGNGERFIRRGKWDRRRGRGVDFSSRSPDDSILFMPNHAKWRTHRKAMHSALSVTAVHKYKPVQSFESQRMALNLLQNPANFREAIERCQPSRRSLLRASGPTG
jgi:hypothetical protein